MHTRSKISSSYFDNDNGTVLAFHTFATDSLISRELLSWIKMNLKNSTDSVFNTQETDEDLPNSISHRTRPKMKVKKQFVLDTKRM